eukprot:scaffold75_cov239-Chaetoceros_neogracile.AAC.11
MTDHVMASTAPNSLEEGSNSEVEEHQNLLSFRPIQQSDRDQLKALHEELFPVKYTEEFYNNVVKNKSLGGSPLYSRIAVWNRHQDPGMEIQNDLMEQLARYVDVHVRVFLDLELEDSVILSDSQGLSSLQDMESGDADEIMSCIIGGFVKCNEMKDRSIAAALIRNMYTHPRMFYIMTLGNTMRFRKQKLGTKMIYDCLTMIEKVPTCGAVYLHVITHNTAAIKFYEKLGFYRIEEIEDYYKIDDAHYNCYLYAYFVNVYDRIAHTIGNSPTFYHVISSYSTIIPTAAVAAKLRVIGSRINKNIPHKNFRKMIATNGICRFKHRPSLAVVCSCDMKE